MAARCGGLRGIGTQGCRPRVLNSPVAQTRSHARMPGPALRGPGVPVIASLGDSLIGAQRTGGRDPLTLHIRTPSRGRIEGSQTP